MLSFVVYGFEVCGEVEVVPFGVLESEGSGDGLMTRGMPGTGSEAVVPDMAVSFVSRDGKRDITGVVSIEI